jgi:hypothetical protein
MGNAMEPVSRLYNLELLVITLTDIMVLYCKKKTEVNNLLK